MTLDNSSKLMKIISIDIVKKFIIKYLLVDQINNN